MKNTIYVLGLAALIFGTVSCKKKEGGDENTDGSPSLQSGYVVGFRSADGTADYILAAEDLMAGTISSTGTGIEQTGWCYYTSTFNKYFTMNYTENFCTGYKINNGVFYQSGQFVFDRIDVMNHDKENDVIVGIGAPWGGGSYEVNFQIINPNSVSITSNSSQVIYAPIEAGTQLNTWPTAAHVIGNRLYVPFYPLKGDTWETPQTDTAYIAVYSYPGFQQLDVIKDDRTGPIGYYGDQPCLLEDESGMIYTISSSSFAAGYTQSTKPSAIMKFDPTTNTFDQSFFMNIENEGYKILTGVYAGNGKIVARVIPTSSDVASGAGSWAAFSSTNPICNIAVIDVNTQTFTLVTDIPTHGGQYKTPFYVEDGYVYVSINDGNEAFVYQVDPNNASATKGAAILGSELQYITKF